MSTDPTPAPGGPKLTESTTPSLDLIPKILDIHPDEDGDVAGTIGGIVAAVCLALICFMAVLLWFLCRQKGSYVTNEMDEEDDVDDIGNEEESLCTDMALRTKEPLTAYKDD